MNKETIAKFNKSMMAFIIENGGGEVLNDMANTHEYIIETKAGLLRIALSDTPSSLFTMFCRFKDVDKANKFNLAGLNQYSGKYNFHTSNPLEQSLEAAEIHISQIL